MKQHRHHRATSPVLLFLAAALLLLIGLPLIQKGTFIDGQLYKTVAFNASLPGAAFWRMQYTHTCMNFFCEQPPLYPYLLGIFYRLFGTHYLVDRLFTALLLLGFLLIIKAVIRQSVSEKPWYFLLFVFCMLSVPIWCWSYANQVIEPLVCVFIAAEIYCFVKFLSSKKIIHGFLFGLLMYGCFLTKGFQSCFLVILPLSYFLLAEFKKPVLYFTVVSALILGLGLAFVIAWNSSAMDWYHCYFNARLVLTMNNVGNTTNDHAEIIVRFFTELVVPIAIVVMLMCFLAFKKKYPLKFAFKNFLANKLAVALLITSLAGSFPYAISLVQRGFYLVPSFACFLLAIIIGLKRYWLFFAQFVTIIFRPKLVQGLCVLLFSGSLIYTACQYHSYKRDKGLLTDIGKMLPYLKEKDTVLIRGDLWNYFNLHSYLHMAKQVNLIDDKEHRKFLILAKTQENTDSAYVKLNLNTEGLDLFERK